MRHSLEDFIESTNKATNVSELFAIFERFLRIYGYDRVIYTLFNDHQSAGLYAGHGIVKNYPEDWMAHYKENLYYFDDPVVKTACNTNRSFTWDSLKPQYEGIHAQKIIMLEAQEAKLLDGMAVPLHGAKNESAGIGLASSLGGIDISYDLISTIDLACRQFHLRYLLLYETSLNKRYNNIDSALLTSREKDILKWMWSCKSNSVIGDILGITENTVRFHVRNIFQKLNVSNKQMAVLKAIELRIINV